MKENNKLIVMIELILACNIEGGIGFQNSIPWKIKDDLNIFKIKTMGYDILCGTKTYKNLPKLEGRRVHRVSKKDNLSIESIISELNGNKIFVIGGAEIYNEFLNNYNHLIEKIHLSIIKTKENYECDTFVDINKVYKNFIIEEVQEFSNFSHYVFVPENKGEIQYLKLLRNVIHTDNNFEGRNGSVLRNVVNHMKFNLQNEFPLLTTKRMFFRGIVEELLFFLRGETNSKILEEKGINIWKGNTCKEFQEKTGLNYPEGEMGPMYGYQWRQFNSNKDLDQLSEVINQIKNEPSSRRILLTDYNPLQAKEGVLYPCHSIIIQFFVEGDYLDMFCYNRSSDLFLGLPFNIASSSLMLLILAKMTGKIGRYFNLSLGDCHIYKEEHTTAVLEQLQRIPYKFPKVEIKDFEKIEDITFDHFILKDYKCHNAIKAKMVS
jgi:dihydrofolate reductase/thymidylate synthase